MKTTKLYPVSEKVAEKLNNFFIEVVDNLEIESFVQNTARNIQTKSKDEITKIYETHPSISEIKNNVNVENKFLFTNTTAIDFKDEINKLDPNKAGIENDIPT